MLEMIQNWVKVGGSRDRQARTKRGGCGHRDVLLLSHGRERLRLRARARLVHGWRAYLGGQEAIMPFYAALLLLKA